MKHHPRCTDLLLGTRPQSATDPKDKIFAFQGLLELLDIDLPSPQYNKSAKQVYSEAAVAAIYHDNSLRLLASVTGESQIPGLPFWVPDWSNCDFITEIASWNAAWVTRTNPPRYVMSESSEHLGLEGIIIDRIRYASDTYPAFHDLGNSADEIIRNIARCKEVAVLKTWFTTFQELPGVDIVTFFSGLVQEAWSRERHPANLESEILTPYWIDAVKCVGLQASAVRTIPNHIYTVLRGSNLDLPTKFKIREAILPFHQTMRRLLDRKRIFKTRHGQLGMGCRALQNGDRIALFIGCNLPMVIKRAQYDHQWNIVSPVYLENAVHNGSTWTSEGRLKTFVIV